MIRASDPHRRRARRSAGRLVRFGALVPRRRRSLATRVTSINPPPATRCALNPSKNARGTLPACRQCIHPIDVAPLTPPQSTSALASNPHSHLQASSKLPATSCLCAFRPPAAGARGQAAIPAAENLHRSCGPGKGNMAHHATACAGKKGVARCVGEPPDHRRPRKSARSSKSETSDTGQSARRMQGGTLTGERRRNCRCH